MPRIPNKERLETDDEEQNEEPKKTKSIDADEVVEYVVDTLHELKLKLPRRPKASDGSDLDLRFPRDITACSNDKLGQLLGDYARMIEYTGAQLALLDIRHGVANDNEKYIRTIVQLRGEGSIKNKEAQAIVSQTTRDRAVEHHKQRGVYKLVQSLYESYVNNHKTISREITRRNPNSGREL